MAQPNFTRIGSLKNAELFIKTLEKLQLAIPCDRGLLVGESSPLLRPVSAGNLRIGNRIAVHPMEGWDGTADGRATEPMLRRWKRFGASGAKLIWGGEAFAVRHDGRANPNQLFCGPQSRGDLTRLREGLVEEHVRTTGSADGLVIGLQLTHSGRYSVPNVKGRPEPRVAMRHPILDKRMGITSDERMFTDDEIRKLIDDFIAAAQVAHAAGFNFVDVKHCHGYLGHEFLGSHTRKGDFGGSFENRTRFLREVVEGIRANVPALEIGVRVSAFDMVPFRPDPEKSSPGKPGPGIPETYADILPYRWGFGVNAVDPTALELSETFKFFELLMALGIHLVNVSAGSPYYNPHIQRPASYPPSDGYLPPEDPLVGVARQMGVVRTLKQKFPNLVLVGSGYSYLQDFVPHVAQAAIEQGWTDIVGLGRMVLSYPQVLWDAANGTEIQTKMICRTFSDCTTAPRNGLPSGCYPLDAYYKDSAAAAQLKTAKTARRAD